MNTIKQIKDALGRPLNDLRISLTDRCNFNCTYCMPDKNTVFMPRGELLNFEEIERFVQLACQLGVQKIKLTGGEPTLRMGLDILIKKLVAIPELEDIGLITNGYFLKSIGYRLKEAGLERISISLDALDERVFQNMVGQTNSVHPVLEGIKEAERLGFSPIKINCVIQRGINDNQILPLVEYFRRPNFHLRFIEFMDVGSIDWDYQHVVSSLEILELVGAKYPLEPVASSYEGEVATRYKYKDGMGEVGFISSVTNPFCEDCSRLRLSADGILYGCLFTNKGLAIKPLLKQGASDEEILQALSQFWQARNDRYSEERAELHTIQKRNNMNFMGG